MAAALLILGNRMSKRAQDPARPATRNGWQNESEVDRLRRENEVLARFIEEMLTQWIVVGNGIVARYKAGPGRKQS